MTISDIYDALTAADRPYKRSLPAEQALDILAAEAEAGKVDAVLFRVFVDSGTWRASRGGLTGRFEYNPAAFRQPDDVAPHTDSFPMTTASENTKTANRQLRVGVLGVGYLGRFHAKIYAAMPDVELVGVADVNASAAKTVADQYGCRAYTDGRELLDKVDAVSVVVPTVYHAEVARPFLERKVHMLMEKPIAPTYDESLALVEQAEAAGVIFQIGHLERFNAGVMALAEHCVNPRFIRGAPPRAVRGPRHRRGCGHRPDDSRH